MLPLVSSSRPMCRGGASSGLPAKKNRRDCFFPFDHLEVFHLQAGHGLALLVGDADAELDEVDTGLEASRCSRMIRADNAVVATVRAARRARRMDTLRVPSA